MAAIEILREDHQLPDEFDDHPLSRQLEGYRDFHVRDTPKGNLPSESNDVVVVYRIDENKLTIVAINIGSHSTLFGGNKSSKKYRKNN